MNNDYILLFMMIALLVGSLIYRVWKDEQDFKKAHNKRKKKKFWI